MPIFFGTGPRIPKNPLRASRLAGFLKGVYPGRAGVDRLPTPVPRPGVAQLIVKVPITVINDQCTVINNRTIGLSSGPIEQANLESCTVEQIRLGQRWWLSPKQNISSAVSCEVATVADVVALTSFVDVLPGGIIHSGCL